MRFRVVMLALMCALAAPLRAQGGAEGDQRPLVQALQRRVLEVVQQTLGATDGQMRQLVEVNRKYEGERRTLNQRDREARQTIRAEVLRDSLADQSTVARMLDELYFAAEAHLAGKPPRADADRPLGAREPAHKSGVGALAGTPDCCL